MEVILLERVEKLGQMGDLVNVKPGFARNFLLPKKKAVTATALNKADFEKQRVQLQAQNLEQKTEAEKIGTKLAGKIIVMVRQAGDAGQLYGSVSARDISDGISSAGFSVNRNQIKLVDPIKSIGMHPVSVTLHPEVIISVKINVARSIEEAEIQESKGTVAVNDENPTEAVDKLIDELDAEEANMPSETEAEDQARVAKMIEESENFDSENEDKAIPDNQLTNDSSTKE
jgi:large subunit ribosomal protein L9